MTRKVVGERCIVTECVDDVHSRGLCRSCYVFASSLVRTGLATWDMLESSGCILPRTSPYIKIVRPERVEYFADALGIHPDRIVGKLRAYNTERMRRQRSKA
jgi:hypothetical protein